ncbi:MAG: hypothetical protein Q8M26_11625 [Pseudolabrys sp.]|nr:hypothetical protein [Pseudolabrys sp.]
MAKRNLVSRTFRSTRKTLSGYFKPSAKTAEATIEQLLDALADARKSLRSIGGSKKKKRKAKKKNPARKKRAAAAKTRTMARRAARTTKRKTRVAGIATRKRPVVRKSNRRNSKR